MLHRGGSVPGPPVGWECYIGGEAVPGPVGWECYIGVKQFLVHQ